MQKTMSFMVALMMGGAMVAGCATAPATYTNEYVTNHQPRQAYQIASIDSDGYVADQLVLAMRDKMPSLIPHEGKGDVHVRLSTRMEMYPASKKAMKPVITTVTLQVIRSEDKEIIYSLVKQYPVAVSANMRGKITISTNGWVDQAAAELAQGLAQAIGMEG